MLTRLLLIAGLLTATACTSGLEPKTGPPRYSFTKVELVDVDRHTEAVGKLETPVMLTDSEHAESVFATMPKKVKLMRAYEQVRAQKPDQVWLGLVSYTCLPPLAVNPRYTEDEKVEFGVLVDPENQYVDCARVAPLMGMVGVTDNSAT